MNRSFDALGVRRDPSQLDRALVGCNDGRLYGAGAAFGRKKELLCDMSSAGELRRSWPVSVRARGGGTGDKGAVLTLVDSGLSTRSTVSLVDVGNGLVELERMR